MGNRGNKYLALGDEAGLGGVPGGPPAGGVAEGEDGGLAGGGGGYGRAEEGERRVEADDGGRRRVVLGRVVGAPAVGRGSHRGRACGGTRRRRCRRRGESNVD